MQKNKGELNMKPLTVGELKNKLTNVPNDVIIKLVSDTGVDQGYCGGEIVVEDAWYHKSCISIYDDSFCIYVNEQEEE
jgi:hypothetical protein